MIPDVVPRPHAPLPAGVEILDPRDYPPNYLSLNRRCRDNIHQTIVTEYDTFWPRSEHLDLYLQVYASMSTRLIARIVTQGLANIQCKAYHPNIVVKLITSYLPSELPVDDDGFRALAKQRVTGRKKERKEAEAKVKEEQQRMELIQCLLCRGIELMLQRWDLHEETGHTTTKRRATSATHTPRATEGRKRNRVNDKTGKTTKMNSVKLIYKHIHSFH